MVQSRKSSPSVKLYQLYQQLYDIYGPRHWWPAETAFEVMVGAVLVQNTAWRNVEKAIASLKQISELSPEAFLSLDQAELAEAIHSAGYFRVKATRLQNLCRWLVDSGGIDALAKLKTGQLRKELLSVNGVGPETADDILLYSFDRPVFVVDSYTRRLFERVGLPHHDAPYDDLKQAVEALLPDWPVSQWNELHALIVRHGADRCGKRPVCSGCPLEICPSSAKYFKQT